MPVDASVPVTDGGANDARPLGEICLTADQCGSGHCTDGRCCEKATCAMCEMCWSDGTCKKISGRADDTCKGGICMDDGTCALNNGQPCTSWTACGSKICQDGVCCRTSCEGACVSCNLGDYPGPGTCVPLTGMVDPGLCDSGRICTDAGQCVTGN